MIRMPKGIAGPMIALEAKGCQPLLTRVLRREVESFKNRGDDSRHAEGHPRVLEELSQASASEQGGRNLLDALAPQFHPLPRRVPTCGLI